MTMWNDYEKIARRLDRIANAFERIANALETANIIEADRKTEPITHDDYVEWGNDHIKRNACTLESYSIGQPNSSEKPNNCEHITEDGVTCAKYPACDDCLDNPLNKVKGSERLVKGSEQTEPQTIRCPKCGRTDYIRDMEKDMGIKGSHYKYKCINCNTYIKTEPTSSKMEQVDEPIDRDDLGNCNICKYVGLEHRCNQCVNGSMFCKVEDEPQTDCKMPYEDCEDCETHLKAQYGYCNKCKWYGDKQVCGRCREYNLYSHTKTEPQTEKPKIRKRNDKPFRAVWLDDDHNEIGTPQTDCPWQNDEHIPTELASTMLKNRFKERK